jgi:hypothetical protein
MKRYLAIPAAVLMMTAGAMFSAAPVAATPIGNGQVHGATTLVGGWERVQYGGYCESLRRACIYKDQLGETGEGNCRKYRRECGGAGNYGAPQRYERRQGGQDRCTYWHHRCANAYGWHNRSWHKCMKYGAPGC